MSEKPILFNSEMVRAILDGRKTQTRRVVKPQPDFVTNYYEPNKPRAAWVGGSSDPALVKCPYGQPGDALWVRETWACLGAEHVKPSKIAPGYTVHYKADGVEKTWNVEQWRASIHMPRWASRISLRVTGVQVERVQDISGADAVAEGVEQIDSLTSARYRFVQLWNSINAKRGHSWDSNPWVWVVEFEVIK